MPQQLDGKPVFVHYQNSGMEAVLELDGVHMGGLDTNHHYARITAAAEDDDAWIVRCYEAGRMGGFVDMHFDASVKSLQQVDLLEEKLLDIPLQQGQARLCFKPFEI